MKYCAPLINKSSRETIDCAAKHKERFDLFEIWLDYIEDLSPAFIDELGEELGDRAIYLFRRKNLEKIKLPLSKRKDIIAGIKTGYLDLDIEAQKAEVEFLKKSSIKIKLILSYHNYSKTPSLKELTDIVNRMEESSPSVYKISTFCDSERDLLTLFELLLLLKEKGRSFTVLGMGEAGKVSRIIGPIWGNEFSYTPLSAGECSAPGQFTKEELEGFFSILGKA